jgi:hypothetical protein
MRSLITILLIAFLRLSAGSQAFEWGIEVPQVMTGNAGVSKLETFAIMPDNSIALGGFTKGDQ